MPDDLSLEETVAPRRARSGGDRAAVALAFSSRGLPLTALDDFRIRDSWGLSRGGARKWRSLVASHPAVDDFLATRARVRAAVEALL